MGVIRSFICLFLFLLFKTALCHAETEIEESDLLMFFEKKEIFVVTPTRAQKSILKVADNITVITAREIERMNAQTLADVLYHVPGIQVERFGGPVSTIFAFVQGSEQNHVRIVRDGITLNNQLEKYADIGNIPLQNVEKIEIIKGPASTAWGSSLGGIINIITKPAFGPDTVKGSLHISQGEWNIKNFKGDLYAGANRFGFYFSAERLHSDEFMQNFGYDLDSINSKFRIDWTENTESVVTIGYETGEKGVGVLSGAGFYSDFQQTYSTFQLNSDLSENISLKSEIKWVEANRYMRISDFETSTQVAKSRLYDKKINGTVKLLVDYDVNDLTVGADYERGDVESDQLRDEEFSLESWAIFLNDTVSFGDFSLTPGVRYDYTNTNGEFWSPSVSTTYQVSNGTFFRGNITRGFHTPTLSSTVGDQTFVDPNPHLNVETVWTYQVGVESTDMKYLWAKATLFRHNISNAIAIKLEANQRYRFYNSENSLREGIELEIKTMPFWFTSLIGGFTFVDARNLSTDEKIPSTVHYTVDTGLSFLKKEFLGVELQGHYIWWREHPTVPGKYGTFIWDLDINKAMYKGEKSVLTVFFKGRNILDQSQFLLEIRENPGRRLEIGLRMKF